MDNDIEVSPDMVGWGGVFFHPDLIRSTLLGTKIGRYSFFSYEMSEALHLSEKEKKTLYQCVQKIESGLQENIDGYSQNIITSAIELLLNYCTRFYSRQFITRKSVNSSITSQIEKILVNHLKLDHTGELGLPTVNFLADKVHLSPNYLSDLLKKETGRNTRDYPLPCDRGSQEHFDRDRSNNQRDCVYSGL